MGNDSKVLARTGKYVDLWGVDDHKVDDLELVTAGAVVETQTGPIIIIMNQYTRMAHGKTIHSVGANGASQGHCEGSGPCNHWGRTLYLVTRRASDAAMLHQWASLHKDANPHCQGARNTSLSDYHF